MNLPLFMIIRPGVLGHPQIAWSLSQLLTYIVLCEFYRSHTTNLWDFSDFSPRAGSPLQMGKGNHTWQTHTVTYCMESELSMDNLLNRKIKVTRHLLSHNKQHFHFHSVNQFLCIQLLNYFMLNMVTCFLVSYKNRTNDRKVSPCSCDFSKNISLWIWRTNETDLQAPLSGIPGRFTIYTSNQLQAENHLLQWFIALM